MCGLWERKIAFFQTNSSFFLLLTRVKVTWYYAIREGTLVFAPFCYLILFSGEDLGKLEIYFSKNPFVLSCFVFLFLLGSINIIFFLFCFHTCDEIIKM